MSEEQWSKKMQIPSRNIHIHKCVLVCAWFVLSHRSTWCGGGANRERNRQIVVALMCAQSSVNRIHARWKEQKKQHHRTTVSLQTTTVGRVRVCLSGLRTLSHVRRLSSCRSRRAMKQRETFSLTSSRRADDWHTLKGKQNSPHHI